MTVIGTDTRTQVSSTTTGANSAIVRIQATYADGAIAIGTGEIIDSTHVVTSGHVIYDAAHGGYATSVSVAPGATGGTNPLGVYTASELHVDPRYAAAAAYGSSNTTALSMDFGTITLSSKVTTVDPSQFFHLTVETNAQLTGQTVKTAGYPGDLDKTANTQYQTSGTIAAVSAKELYSTMDIYNGQSGSPVWVDSASGQHDVVGIVDFGSTNYNGFTRITQGVLDEVNAVVAADNAGTTITAAQEMAAYDGTTAMVGGSYFWHGSYGFGGFGYGYEHA